MKDLPPGPTAPGFVPVSAEPRPGQRGLAPALQVTLGTGQRCPFCRASLLTDEQLVACVACMTVSHAVCVTEGGGCTTMGCARARVDAAPASPTSSRPAARRRFVAAGLVAGALGVGALSAQPLLPIPLVTPVAPVAPSGFLEGVELTPLGQGIVRVRVTAVVRDLPPGETLIATASGTTVLEVVSSTTRDCGLASGISRRVVLCGAIDEGVIARDRAGQAHVPIRLVVGERVLVDELHRVLPGPIAVVAAPPPAFRVSRLQVMPAGDGRVLVYVTIQGRGWESQAITGRVGDVPLAIQARDWRWDDHDDMHIHDPCGRHSDSDEVTLTGTFMHAGWERVTLPLSVFMSGHEVIRQEVVLEASRELWPQVDLEVPAEARTATVVVKGAIRAHTAQVRVTVEGPGGQEVSWDGQSGPFESAVTLPHPGTHRVRVIVKDAAGRETITTRDVRW